MLQPRRPAAVASHARLACGRAHVLRSGPCCCTARARCMRARSLQIGCTQAGQTAAAVPIASLWHSAPQTPRLTPLASTPAPHPQLARKRQLTDELVQIRTQKAEVLRQIQAIAKRQKTGGLPTKAAELLAGNNKLVLQMEQRNRAEKVRRPLPSVLRAGFWAAGCAAPGCSPAARLRRLAMQRAKRHAAFAAMRSVVVLLRCAHGLAGIGSSSRQPPQRQFVAALLQRRRRWASCQQAVALGRPPAAACAAAPLLPLRCCCWRVLSSADLGGLRQDHPGHAEEPADQDLLWRACAGAQPLGAQPLGAAGCCCFCGCWGLAVAAAGCCCQLHAVPARVAIPAVVGGCLCCRAAHRPLPSAAPQLALCRRATCPTTTRSLRTLWIWAPSRVRVRIGGACSCNSRRGHGSKAAAGCWLVPRAVQHPQY